MQPPATCNFGHRPLNTCFLPPIHSVRPVPCLLRPIMHPCAFKPSYCFNFAHLTHPIKLIPVGDSQSSLVGSLSSIPRPPPLSILAVYTRDEIDVYLNSLFSLSGLIPRAFVVPTGRSKEETAAALAAQHPPGNMSVVKIMSGNSNPQLTASVAK